MFREVARKKKVITTEDCIHILKTEKRGVLSVLGAEYQKCNCIWENGCYR